MCCESLCCHARRSQKKLLLHITRQKCTDGLTQLPRVAANWHAQSACHIVAGEHNGRIILALLQRCVVCATADYTVYRSLLASGPVTTLAGQCFHVPRHLAYFAI